MKHDLLFIYERLLERFGSQGWWPADTPFEVIVGTILTQATNWNNVEKAIQRLKKKGLLSVEGILNTQDEDLARIIKPALYHNTKARKLKSFVKFLGSHYNRDLEKFLRQPRNKLRKELLSIYGIGQETADSIILYAANKKSFVIDAYTKRILSRIGLVDRKVSYQNLKELMEENLPKSLKLYQEFHALLVELGKNYCKKKPICRKCPVEEICGWD